MFIEGLLAMALSGAGQERPDLILDIRRELEDGRPVYAGMATSRADATLGYRLYVTCNAGSNLVTSRQSGERRAPAGERVTLSTLSCSANTQGRVEARLEVGYAPFERGDEPVLSVERVFEEPAAD